MRTAVSVLFNEPKLLKRWATGRRAGSQACFSALQRAEIAETPRIAPPARPDFSVSVLFNEPKLLKLPCTTACPRVRSRFSALQRAEIAEISNEPNPAPYTRGFSALQRAEIAEIACPSASALRR